MGAKVDLFKSYVPRVSPKKHRVLAAGLTIKPGCFVMGARSATEHLVIRPWFHQRFWAPTRVQLGSFFAPKFKQKNIKSLKLNHQQQNVCKTVCWAEDISSSGVSSRTTCQMAQQIEWVSDVFFEYVESDTQMKSNEWKAFFQKAVKKNVIATTMTSTSRAFAGPLLGPIAKGAPSCSLTHIEVELGHQTVSTRAAAWLNGHRRRRAHVPLFNWAHTVELKMRASHQCFKVGDRPRFVTGWFQLHQSCGLQSSENCQSVLIWGWLLGPKHLFPWDCHTAPRAEVNLYRF